MTGDLPPEAFTKETLQEAFNWLQEQPEPVRATVHTPERLVSLYQKSLRLTDVDAPVSSRKFMDDLKNLASSLNQFEPSTENRQIAKATVTQTETKKAHFELTTEKTTAKAPEMDPLSLEKIRQVRQRFNLSSDMEAIRVLIALGFEKFSQFQ